MNKQVQNETGQQPAAAPAPATDNGIAHAEDHHDRTATVLLSRQGMGMTPQKKQEVPTPPSPEVASKFIYSVATETDMGCPRCKERFEIDPEYYNAVAECPDCGCEFVIKPPGTPPYRPPQSSPSSDTSRFKNLQAPPAGPAAAAKAHPAVAKARPAGNPPSTPHPPGGAAPAQSPSLPPAAESAANPTIEPAAVQPPPQVMGINSKKLMIAICVMGAMIIAGICLMVFMIVSKYF